MVPVTLYTDSDAIRGCLGVTDNELLDEMIVGAQVALELEADLDDWLPDHALLLDAPTVSAATVAAVQLTYTEALDGLSWAVTNLSRAQSNFDAAEWELAVATSTLETAQQNPPVDPATQTRYDDAVRGYDQATSTLNEAKRLLDLNQAEVDTAKAQLDAAKATAKRDTRSVSLLRLYSMWFCATSCISIMQMAAPKKHTNGKDAFERFVADMDSLKTNAMSKADQYRTSLAALQQVDVSSTPAVMAAVSNPAYDPITNDGFSG